MSDRVYFDKSKLDDALLKTYITADIIAESTEYVESFALSLGISPEQIATPTPYKVSRYAELFAYMTTAQKKATFSVGKDANNDSFSLKYSMYKQLLNDCEKSLTADTFTNGIQAKKRRFPLSIRMSRS